MSPRVFKVSLAILIAVGSSMACVRKSSRTGASQNSNSQPPQRITEDGTLPTHFGLQGVTPVTPRNSIGSKFVDVSLNDVLISLAMCECLPRLQAALVTGLNDVRGALPQALTPAVRREILGNSKLKILDIVPRPIDDFVGGLFADEQTVASEISTGLKEKIKAAEPSWFAEADKTVLQLDGFPPLPGTLSPTSGRAVRLLDVWTRWALVLSHGGPWHPERSSQKTAGLFWHELLRTLAEGEYLFGLAGTEDGNTWGGLTLPVDLQINNPGPFDPRKSYSQVRFLSGEFDLTLGSNNSLSLARFGGERWSWRQAPIPLAEQAIQWWVAAKLLQRLRPANRGPMTLYFHSVVPEDSYQLSLLVLPALDSLLSERYIDERSRMIRSYVSGAQVGGVAPGVREKADPQTLSLLLAAMSQWINELKSTADLKLSPETASQLANAPASLLRGARLIVQTLLGETIAPRLSGKIESGETPYSVFVHPRRPDEQELTIREHAQILFSLVSAEQNLMPSAYLRARIVQLATGLVQRWQDNRSFDKLKDPIAPLLWVKRASELFVSAYPQSTPSESMKTMAAEVNTWLASFEDFALQ